VDLYIHSPIRLHGVVLNYLSTGTTLPYIIIGGYIFDYTKSYLSTYICKVSLSRSKNTGDVIKTFLNFTTSDDKLVRYVTD
jgi:hypothetical protein